MSHWEDDSATGDSVGGTAEEFMVGGRKIIVEVVEPNISKATYQRYAAGAGAPRSMEEAIDNSLPAAALLMERLVALPTAPKSIEVEFGIKLSGKVGALIASTSVEGNFRVKLSWDKNEDSSTV